MGYLLQLETSCRCFKKPLGDSLKAALFVLTYRSGKRLFDAVATIMWQGMGVVKVFAAKIVKPTSRSNDHQLILNPRAVFTHQQVHSHHRPLMKRERSIQRCGYHFGNLFAVKHPM
jgi:hypothetical protein